MSKLNDRSIRPSDWGIPDTRDTSTRAFTGVSGAERILNARIISTDGSIRVEPGRRTSEGGHPIRWPSREAISTLTQRGPRRRYLEGPATRPQQEPSVPGLLLVPQATSDGELYRFITKYKVYLADAGGTLLTWMRIGDPEDQDRIFRDQIGTASEHELKSWIAEYEAGVKDARSQEHYIDRENLEILKALGLPQRTLPAVFFLAPQPVLAWAVLRLDVAMFLDPIAERSLATHFIEDLGSDKLAAYAKGGGFTATRMKSLQRYLDSVEQETRKGTNMRMAPPALVVDQQRNEPAPYQQPAVAADTYALAYGPGGDWSQMTRAEYMEACAQLDDIDYLIDAIGLKCRKRNGRNMPHQEANFTFTQMHMISQTMLRSGLHRPHRLRGEDAAVTDAANRMMQVALFKVEGLKGAERNRLFVYHKGAAPKDHRYEFAPPAGISWRLFVPVV